MDDKTRRCTEYYIKENENKRDTDAEVARMKIMLPILNMKDKKVTLQTADQLTSENI